MYDLLWFLSDPSWPLPNLVMLNNALRQMGWSGAPLRDETWRLALRARVKDAAWEQIVADVRPFLEPSASSGLFILDNLLCVLG